MREEIYQVLSENTELTTLVGSNIYFLLLPENFDMSNTGMFFNVSKGEQIKDLSGFVLQTEYNLSITIVSMLSTILMSVANTIEDILDAEYDQDVTDYVISEIGYDAEENTNVLEISFTITK